MIRNIMGDCNDDHVALCANGTTRSEITRGDIEDIDIDGISKELRAHSKIQNVEDGFIGKPKAPKFKPKTVGHFRDVDTEYKILEEIAKQIGG